MALQEKTDELHQKIYDFLLYLYPQIKKYPKFEKYSLQKRTRDTLLDLMDEITDWQKTKTKLHIYAADKCLQRVKILIRLANDLKYSAMNAQHYGESCRRLAEVGVMMGEIIEEIKASK